MDSGKYQREFVCKPSVLLYLAVFGTLLGAFSIGLISGYASPAVPSMERNSSSPHYDEKSDAEVESWIRSSPLMSGIVGSLAGGYLAGVRGTRICLIVTCLPLSLGWLLIGIAVNSSMIISGRLITGLIGGIHCAVIPGFVNELSPPKYQGILGTFFQVSICIGIFAESLIGAFTDWKALAFLSTIPSLAIGVILFFVPDSPVYLFNKFGGSKLTLRALQKYRTEDSQCNEELDSMARTPRERQKAILVGHDLRKPFVTKPLVLVMIILTIPQAMGVSAIVFNEKDIFKKSGVTIDADLCSIILNFLVIIATIISAILTKYLKRRTLLLISGIGSTISMASLSIYFFNTHQDPSFSDRYGLLALASTIAFLTFFSLGWAPIPWVICPEMCPYFASGFIMALGCFMNWFSAFLITKEFGDLQDLLTPGGTFGLFGFICFLANIFTIMYIPETKDKSNEEILVGFGKLPVVKYPIPIGFPISTIT